MRWRAQHRRGNIRNSVNFPACEMAPTGKTRITIGNKNVPNVISQLTSVVGSRCGGGTSDSRPPLKHGSQSRGPSADGPFSREQRGGAHAAYLCAQPAWRSVQAVTTPSTSLKGGPSNVAQRTPRIQTFFVRFAQRFPTRAVPLHFAPPLVRFVVSTHRAHHAQAILAPSQRLEAAIMFPFLRHTLSRVRPAPVSICAVALKMAVPFVACLIHAGSAWALPSCPTLIYEGVTPAANGLIDPGRPTVTFRFNRTLVEESVRGAAVLLEQGPERKSGRKLWTNMPPKVLLFNDYGNLVRTDGGRVDGSNIHVTPLDNLAPNKQYRFLIQAGTGYPLLAHYPDSWSRFFCNMPRIEYNIAANFYTRPTATGGCVTSPTNVTTTRWGLVRGCRYNFFYESEVVLNEDAAITNAFWVWGHAKFNLRSYTGYPVHEKRGVGVGMKNIHWDGKYWVAEWAAGYATGLELLPDSPGEGDYLADYRNVVVAFNDDILEMQHYFLESDGYRYDRTASGIRGKMTLSPAP